MAGVEVKEAVEVVRRVLRNASQASASETSERCQRSRQVDRAPLESHKLERTLIRLDHAGKGESIVEEPQVYRVQRTCRLGA